VIERRSNAGALVAATTMRELNIASARAFAPAVPSCSG
jgi:hypothetical protein